jgi:hypothetical protein
MATSVVVGVDVGGTNTDAVVLTKAKGQGHRVLAEDKHLTTSDVTTGQRMFEKKKIKFKDRKFCVGQSEFVFLFFCLFFRIHLFVLPYYYFCSAAGVRNAVLTVLRQARATQGELIVTQVGLHSFL